MLSDLGAPWIVAMHEVGNTGNRTGLERKVFGMSLGDVVENIYMFLDF